jgi:hypothetical protein
VNRPIHIIGLVLALSCPGNAQEQRCHALVPTLRTWDALYKSFQSNGRCDDGLIGEGYSESVARILVDRWNTTPRLASLVTKSIAFRQFVLRHIDASLDTNDLEKIKARTKTQCPQGLRVLCDDLEKQASSALKESAAPR